MSVPGKAATVLRGTFLNSKSSKAKQGAVAAVGGAAGTDTNSKSNCMPQEQEQEQQPATKPDQELGWGRLYLRVD